MINSGIYKIVNTINKKEYYGSTNDFNRRCREHFDALTNNSHYNRHLQKSVNKHGVDNFVFMIVEYVEDRTKLLNIEQNYLDVFWDGGINCYNIACAANAPMLGKKHSKEVIEQLTIRMLGNTYTLGMTATDATKLKMSIAQQGRKHSEETRTKMSQKLLGNTRNRGRKFSTTHRENLSKSHKLNTTYNKPCMSINLQSGEELLFESITSAALYYNIAKQNVSSCINGRLKSCKNKTLTFKYIISNRLEIQ